MADNRKVVQTGKVFGITDKSAEQYPSKKAIIKFQSGKYESALEFEFKGEAMNLLDGIQTGDTVEITGYISGRTYTDKNGNLACFNSLAATELSRQVGGEKPQSAVTPSASSMAQSTVNEEDEGSDLPF